MAYGTISVNEEYYVCTPALSYVKELFNVAVFDVGLIDRS